MIIIRIIAGLGNQMFQYALGKYLLEKGEEVFFDTSSYANKQVHNGFEIDKVFEINYTEATQKQIQKVRRFIPKLTVGQRIIRKLKLSLKCSYAHITEKDFGTFNPKIHKLKGDYYLDGYWQSEKYFIEIEEIIRKEFQFKPELDKRNKEFVEKLKSTNSVAIHVRRGDMVNNPLHGNICTKSYFQKAMQKINDKVQTPQYVFFSDDIEWCKNNFSNLNAWFVDWNTKENNYKDMQLMSLCKHNIIANSSFSWWGAWLNSNPDKIVIAPNKWLNGKYSTKELIPENWKKIDIT